MERLLIDLLLNFMSAEQLYDALDDPRMVAILIGAMVAVSGALLGTFLLLRHMALTSDAISHTVLLGIVVAFIVMVYGLDQEADISSPWLIVGAALSGVLTVYLTELIFRSGLVKEDAALGLAFPLLFAIAIILISRYADDIHLDEDTVMVGEIGVAWANANEHCFANCEEVVITPDHPKAETGRQCINCKPSGPYSPRDPEAIFKEICSNCGTYPASIAYTRGYIDTAPQIVLWPRAITTMGVITLVNALFVLLLYKELKLATFDAGLAAALGFRPGLLHYALMALVSVTAVGAFDAVGAVLVVAFFIVPAATAYLLTDRLWRMLVLSSFIGALAAYTGYDLARGDFLGIYNLDKLLVFLDKHVLDLGGNTTWNVHIASAMVMMTGFFFLLAWVVSPRYGLVSNTIRRMVQRRRFREQLLLMHIHNHENTENANRELALDTLHMHLNWSENHLKRMVARLRSRNLVRVQNNLVIMTDRGERLLQKIMQERISA